MWMETSILVTKKKKAEELGVELIKETDVDPVTEKSNQIILSGTAYYDFNHFAEYWKRYRSIVNSKGDRQKLKEVLVMMYLKTLLGKNIQSYACR